MDFWYQSCYKNHTLMKKNIITHVQCTGTWTKSQNYGSKMNEFESQIVRITAQWTRISTKFKY